MSAESNHSMKRMATKTLGPQQNKSFGRSDKTFLQLGEAPDATEPTDLTSLPTGILA